MTIAIDIIAGVVTGSIAFWLGTRSARLPVINVTVTSDKEVQVEDQRGFRTNDPR